MTSYIIRWFMVSAWIRHVFDSDSDSSRQATVDQDDNSASSDSEQKCHTHKSPSNEADDLSTKGRVSTILNHVQPTPWYPKFNSFAEVETLVAMVREQDSAAAAAFQWISFL